MLASLWAGAVVVGRAQASAYAVNSIQDLRSVSYLTYTRVFVAGYTTPGDGGGGLYVYDPAGVGADNGGTVIVNPTDLGYWKLSQASPPTIVQFGAIDANSTTSTTDSTCAIQHALDACSVVVFPPGAYVCTHQIMVHSGNALIGEGGHGQVVTTGPNGADHTGGTARLLFYNGTAGDACLASDSNNPLQHASIKHVGIYVDQAAAYSWMIHFTEPVGLELDDVNGSALGPSIGGIRCNVRPGNLGSSYGNHFYEVSMTLQRCTVQCEVPGHNANGCPICETLYSDYFPGNGYTLDLDFTDSEFLSGHFSGGHGVILRGPGGINFTNVRIDQSLGYNVIIEHDVANSASNHSFTNCLFEQCILGQVLVDLDAQDSDTPNAMPRFVGNAIWTPPPDLTKYTPKITAITVKNATGPAQTKGGIFTGNYFFANQSPTVFAMDNGGGLGWTIAYNKYTLNPATALPDFTALSGAKISEDSWVAQPLQNVDGFVYVLGQRAYSASDPLTAGYKLTGSTAEAALATIPVSGGLLSSTGKLRISATYSVSGTAAGDSARIRFGSGLSGTVFSSSTVTGSGQTLIHVLCEISMRDAAVGQISAQSQTSAGPGLSTGSLVSGLVDTTVNQSITLSGQLATSTDTLTLEQYTVELVHS